MSDVRTTILTLKAGDRVSVKAKIYAGAVRGTVRCSLVGSGDHAAMIGVQADGCPGLIWFGEFNTTSVVPLEPPTPEEVERDGLAARFDAHTNWGSLPLATLRAVSAALATPPAETPTKNGDGLC